jgi:hypothetical protein
MSKLSTTVLVLFFVSLSSRAQQLYSNGSIATGTLSQSGTIAPKGSQWSELQSDASKPEVSNAVPGWGTTGVVTSEAADDFVVPAGQTWTISSFRFMGYQPNATGTSSPFSKLTLRVWRGQPGTTKNGSFFGDSTTNRLAGATDALVYRVFNSLGATGTPATTNRKVWEIEATVAPGLVLQAGTYWVSWSAATTGSHAYFFVPVTTVGVRTPARANSRLRSHGPFGTYTWSPIIDPGTDITPADVNVEMAFKIFGTNSRQDQTGPMQMSRPGSVQPDRPASVGLSLQASPIPATEAVQIVVNQFKINTQLLLTDFRGQLVWTGQLPPGSSTATVPVGNLTSGTYLLEARTATGSARTRIVKQ